MTAVYHDTGWIVRMRPNPRAAVRLLCFPYAGGGASVFRRWAAHLPDFIDVCAVQLPGREQRIGEEPYRAMDDLIPALYEGLSPLLDRPHAFFGHSMGATIAFELARQIRRSGLDGPQLLLVSGNKAPQLPEVRPPFHQLPRAEFWQAVCGLNRLAAEAAANEELLELLTPMLRADFTLSEHYAFRPEPPLPCPITALGGEEDGLVSTARLSAWAEQTASEFRLHLFPGDHFFINTAWPAVLRVVARELEPVYLRSG